MNKLFTPRTCNLGNTAEAFQRIRNSNPADEIKYSFVGETIRWSTKLSKRAADTPIEISSE